MDTQDVLEALFAPAIAEEDAEQTAGDKDEDCEIYHCSDENYDEESEEEEEETFHGGEQGDRLRGIIDKLENWESILNNSYYLEEKLDNVEAAIDYVKDTLDDLESSVNDYEY